MANERLPRAVRDALASITNADLADADFTVCLASSPEEGLPEYHRLSITDAVRVEFENVVRDARSTLTADDTVFRAYSAGSKPDQHEVEYLAVSEVPFVEVQFDPLDTPVGLATFTGNDQDFLRTLRFYVIVVEVQGQEPIYWCRGYSQQKELGHSPLFGILMRQGQFDRVQQPMFLFDQYLDCVTCGDWMFVFRQDGFQKIFRYYEMVKRAAAESLARIEAAIPILNFANLRHDCEGHLQKLAKLRNIAHKPYLQRITMTDLKRAIKRFHLPVTVRREDGKEYLVYDPADKWAILRLLDDDYLESIMSAEMYEVTGKRVHQTGSKSAAN